MAETLSLHEVLDIARTMESNGVDFYTRAAALYPNPEDGVFFRRLAGMEADHERIFARMQKALPPRPEERTGADDMFEASGLFLQALIASENLEGSGFSRYVFTGKETPSQVVLMGVDLEKATILYYMGLRDMFPVPDEKKVIDQIIHEEKDHLAVLIQEFRNLQASNK
jgi:rubrerythrin